MIVKSVTIGSAADCDIRINDDPYVSPRHARIDQHDNDLFTIQDAGSTNGTFVRRASLPALAKVRLGTGIELRPGDWICVGRTEIPWKESA
jgi:pSer/pThr/pTyr-binding forkhead associated (FHA) protein